MSFQRNIDLSSFSVTELQETEWALSLVAYDTSGVRTFEGTNNVQAISGNETPIELR